MPSAFFLVSDEGPATSTGAGPSVGAPAGGGAAHDGETLSADPGNWNGTGTLTYTYQWQRCDANGDNCQNIAGATGSHYTPTADDVGETVRVVVTATNEPAPRRPPPRRRSPSRPPRPRSAPRRRSSPGRPPRATR